MAATRKGFTLIELLVVIAIIALLVSILVPSVQRARDMAKAIPCLTNTRAMAQGLGMYANEHRDFTPPTFAAVKWNGGTSGWSDMRWWADLIGPYFDTDAHQSPEASYGHSIGVQPADGDYNRYATSKGLVYSKRMNCPARPRMNDYQYYHNLPFASICYGWKMNSDPTYNPGALWGYNLSNSKHKVADYKRPSEFAFIVEFQMPDLTGRDEANGYINDIRARGWPHTNPNTPTNAHKLGAREGMIRAAVHSEKGHMAMLDGHAISISALDILDKGWTSGGPPIWPPN